MNTGSGAAASSGGVAAGEGGIAIGRDIKGGVHYYAAPETPLLRPTPPAPPAHFTGREADLDRLAKLLTSGENVAITALQGMGGIGKTALAQKLAELVKDNFPGGVLWWSLGPQPDVFTALDVWARHASPDANLKDFPDAASRAEVVRSMLARLGRLCAIIDDVWQAEAARALTEAVPPGCPIVITTRDGDIAKDLDCLIEQVDTLSEEESVTLLARLIGPLGNYGPAAREIAQLAKGFPLALKLIHGLADSPADLPQLARKLREKPALEVLQRGETREKSVESCFAMSYATLDADMQRRFRALGVFAPAPFNGAAIAAVWNEEDGERVEQAVRHLTRRNLLGKEEGTEGAEGTEGTGGYRQHALLRAYALALLEREKEYLDTAARHADYYRRFAKEKNWRDVERVFEQIDWGWRWVQSGASDRVVDYVRAVRGFLTVRGRQTERLTWLMTGLQQARAEKEREAEGDLLNSIGWVYDDLGQKDQALDFYQQALAIRREVGDRGGEGATFNNLGLVYSTLGQKEKALDFFQQALAIQREVGDRWRESIVLSNIGLLLDEMGRTGEAVTYLEHSVALDEAIGHTNLESGRAKLEELRRKAGSG